MKTTPKILLAAGLTTTLFLGGCWGNDDGAPVAAAPATSVPDSAGVSPTAFISYLLTLDSSDESSEPLTLSDSFAVPDDETSEPQPLA